MAGKEYSFIQQSFMEQQLCANTLLDAGDRVKRKVQSLPLVSLQDP